jgi:hypothetical protein
LIRKTSLLRIVPTACGQAADIALSQFASAPRFRRLGALTAGNSIAFNARRLRIGRDVTSRSNSRSDPTSSRYQISRTRMKPFDMKPRGLMTVAESISCERAKAPAGGARRDRTDDLLLAKQALSQLSYGPVRGQKTDDRGRKCHADGFSVVRRPVSVV